MPKRYDVYGFLTPDLDEAASLVESLLGVELTKRESDYWGTYYRTGRGPSRDFMLYENGRGGWYSPEHEDYGHILLVNDVEDMDGIRRQLTEGREDVALLDSTFPPNANDENPEPG